MISVGELIDRERYKADITREKLANGICNQQTLYRALVEDSDLSVLPFEMLLERLKRPTDVLEYILSQGEYERLLLRDSIEEAIIEDNTEEARKMLKQYLEDSSDDDEADKMYYYRTLAASYIYGGKSRKDIEEGMALIKKAIRTTLPGINKDNYDSYLFSTYEIENILMYIEALCLLENKQQAINMAIGCYEYIEKTWDNSAMLVRVIPKCVYLMLKYGEGIIDDEKLVQYCEKALTYLREETILYFLIPIMEKVIEIYKRLDNVERAEYWKKYYAFLVDFCREYSSDIGEIPVFYRWKRTAYYLDYEVFKGERLNQGMNQEELADGIYGNPASVSNVEKGKQSPNKTKYRKLCKKLSIDKSRYSGFIIADDFEKIERVADIRKKLSMGNLKEVLEYIEREQPQTNLERHILESYRMIAMQTMIGIDVDKAFKELSDVIESVYPLKKEKYFRRPFRGEIDVILAYLAFLNKNNPTEGLSISKLLLEANKETKVESKHNYRNLMSSYIAYMKSISRIGEMSKNDSTFDESVQLCFEQGIGGALIGVFWSRGLQVKNALGIVHAERYLRYGYLLAELFMNKGADIKRTFYEETFGTPR